jgi:hypothetical protein
MASKICCRCKQEFPITEDYFYRDRTTLNGFYPTCKKCKREQYLKRVALDKEGVTRASRNSHYRKTYGISLEDYEKLLEEQNGVCAICRKPETKKTQKYLFRLAIDHDHETGEVRGLLCSKCNSNLSWYNENIEVFKNFITYLSGGGRNSI